MNTKDFELHEKDTGSTQVQLVAITKRIEEISEHMKTHPKDLHSRRGLVTLVDKRRKFLKYLRAKSAAIYDDVVRKLRIGQ